MKNPLQKIKLNKAVFWPPFLILLGSVTFSFINKDLFASAMNGAYDWVSSNFDWLYAILALFLIMLCLVIFCSPVGKVRFGGEKAKPKYNFFQWFAMSLCGGIAIGITFWGAAEPVTHLMNPPLGITPGSAEAVMFSMSTVFLHWSFTPYAFFAICSIAIALAVHNYNKPMTISSGLYFLIGDRCQGTVGKLVDILCLFALCGSIATSLGSGTMQISSGLQYLFGIVPSNLVWALVALFIIAGFTTSSMLGVDKGIKWLSNQNLKFYIVLLVFILLVGPTTYICKLGVESIGEYLTTFFTKSTFLGAATGDDWSRWWSIYYWAWWLGSAPVVGIFLTRLCYGRTVREFLAVNLIAPSLFGIIWFTIFGGAAIDMQLSGAFDLFGAIQSNGIESAVFGFLAQFPFGFVISIFFLIISAVSFITMADSMTYVAAMMSTTGLQSDAEPPAPLKLVWGLTMGILAWVMICFAGIDGTKMLAVLASFPILIVMIALASSVVKGLYAPNSGFLSLNFKKKNKKAKAEKAEISE